MLAAIAVQDSVQLQFAYSSCEAIQLHETMRCICFIWLFAVVYLQFSTSQPTIYHRRAMVTCVSWLASMGFWWLMIRESTWQRIMNLLRPLPPPLLDR